VEVDFASATSLGKNNMKKLLSNLFLSLSLAFSPVLMAEEFSYSLPRQVVQMLTGPFSSCSAVVVAPERALTAAHCIGAAELLNGKKVEVLRVLSDSDLMLLKVPGLECPCVPIGNEPVLDSDVAAVGYAAGLHQVLTKGTYQGKFTSPLVPDSEGFLVFTSIAEGGFSGGGIFQKQHGKWKLVAITSAGTKTFTAGPGPDKINKIF
jgi:S1-C subfamily serine protease